MRIAIYDPEPRVCGISTWVNQVRDGFRAMGHECYIVGFTKSGKPKVKWGRIVRDKGNGMSSLVAPDVTFSYEEGGEVLDQFDLIVLPEPKCNSHDREADKGLVDFPRYVEVLMATRTPWTCTLGGRYFFEEREIPKGWSRERGSPYLGELLSTKSFSGLVVNNATPGVMTCNSERLRACHHVHVGLPYAVRNPLGEFSMRARPSVGMIGRVTTQKHQHYLLWLITQGLLPGWDVVIAGGSAQSRAPSETYLMYEMLVRKAEVQWGRPAPDEDPHVKALWHWTATRGGPDDDPMDVIRALPWEFHGWDASAAFLGLYEDPLEVLSGVDVHVAVTTSDYSGGLFEYSTLEAMDAGCAPITARAFTPWYCDQFQIEIFEPPLDGHQGGVQWEDGKNGLDPGSDPMAEARCRLLHACVTRAYDMRTQELVQHNREMLVKHNHPRLTCEALLQALDMDKRR